MFYSLHSLICASLYYIDLLCRKNILFDTKYNIVIIEKVIGTHKEISILCPLYNYNETRETIFILKFIDTTKREIDEKTTVVHDKLFQELNYI